MKHWTEARWGDIATLEYGKSLRSYIVGEYPVFGTNGPIGRHSEALSKGPGVIVGRKGAYRGIHFSKTSFYVIDTAFYLKPKTEFDMKWAYYALLNEDINRLDAGSAIPSTTREDFYSLNVRVPPLEQQHEIARILGELDDKIELNRYMNRTLEGMAQAIFKSWFVDFDPVVAKAAGRQPYGINVKTATLFASKFKDSELGLLPEAWAVGDLVTEFRLTMGQSPPGKTYNESGEGLPFFQGRADFQFRFPRRRIYCTQPTRFAEAGDTLVSVRAPVGDINMASEKCAIGRGVAALRHRSGSSSFTYYTAKFLENEFDVFEAQGTLFGSIGRDDFEKLRIVVPPPEVISEFDKIAKPLDDQIDQNERQVNILTAVRDMLLPKMLSGEIRVREAEKVVERVI